nr:AraC family transcriptional regulator [uncultured Flavobacterium sp.]
MYIRSRLKEENVTLYEVEVQDEPNYDSEVQCTEIKYIKQDEITVEGRIYSTDGFIMIETHFNAAVESTDMLTKRGEFIQISLLLTGSVATFKKKFNKVRDLPPGIFQLVYRGNMDVEMKLPGNGKPMRYIRLFLSKKFYLSLISDEKWVQSSPFFKCVVEGKYVHFGKNLIPVSHTALQSIGDILDNNYEGVVKKYFTLHRLKDIFLQLFIYNVTGKNMPAIQDDMEAKLESAKAYLVTHCTNPPTIKQLSRIVSLNEFKLKTGFKDKFGSTIHDYITKIRMQRAKKMIIDNQPVNDVSSQLGYKSVSHFITSFKKFYGVTPKQSMLSKVFDSSYLKVVSVLFTCLDDVLITVAELQLI